MDELRVKRLQGPLIAAATMVSRHAEYAVKVVLPHASDPILEAEQAADLTGVDVVVSHNAARTLVHFVARHQDRRVTYRQLQATIPCARVRNTQPHPRTSPPRPVDVAAFCRASDALQLSQMQDPEVERIWNCMLRSRARAHLCGGIPTLVLNDVGGLVGMLRRRARTLGVGMRINPDACACG